MSDERWLPVVGFETAYEVSDRGRVRSVLRRSGSRPGRILAPATTVGYHRLTLSLGGRRVNRTVHSMVAEAFVGPRPAGCDVNHIDGIKTHNAAANLEYVTAAGNYAHAAKHGLYVPARGEQRSRLTAEQVREIRALRGTLSQRAIATRYGITQGNVSRIQTGRQWTSA